MRRLSPAPSCDNLKPRHFEVDCAFLDIDICPGVNESIVAELAKLDLGCGKCFGHGVLL